MSTTFKTPSSSTLVKTSNPSYTIPSEGGTLKTLTFNRDTSERLLYINYPESILSSTKCYANDNKGNTHIFQTTLNAKETVQLFFSHHNRTGNNLNYAIMIFNPNASSSTANITATNIGYAQGWNTAEFSPWVDFYAGRSKSLPVKGQKTGFLLDWRNIASSSAPFSGIMRVSSDSTVILTVYVWEGSDTSVIDGNEKQYVYPSSDPIDSSIDDKPTYKYTGIGSGYYLTASNTIKYNEANKNGGIYYELASCSSKNSNEMIPIKLSGGNYTAKKGASESLSNLGNWGAQYQFTTTLDNTGNSSDKVFRCYIGRNALEGKVIVNYNGTLGYCSMGLDTSTLGTAYKWNCFEVSVKAGKKETITFQFCHATCSSSPIYMQWT